MSAGYDAECQLCRLVFEREILTPLLHEDEVVMVVDCLVCRTPMAVLKAHPRAFSEAEKQHLRNLMKQIASRRGWNLQESVIDWEQRKIPNHAHCHLRPYPFPGTGHWERL